ncbi:MAG: hypothetical protein ABSC48_05135 [Terracidiphilus sp.]|jgi:hypothetical protein
MRVDPFEEWRRLTELYREMSDEELYELDASIADLTEQAQQILCDEMRTRRLNRPRLASAEADLPERSADPEGGLSAEAATAAAGRRKTGDEAEDDGPYEYTWKTLLCECNEQEEAWQIYLALKEAGIESWVEGPRSQFSQDTRYPRVVVAADQLEQAREIIARPIPQAVVEQFRTPIEDYEPPVCPKCGAEDPVLESAAPVNSWRCESCGKQWTESPGIQDESLDRAKTQR